MSIGLNNSLHPEQGFAFYNDEAPTWLAHLPSVSDLEQLNSYKGYFHYQTDASGQQLLCFTALLDGKPVSMHVDLASGQVAYRRQHGGGRKQHIAKACGLKNNWNPTVIDATGGLGRDAAELRSLGCSLRIIERSAYVASLLQDAIIRARQDSHSAPLFGQCFELFHGQAATLITSLSAQEQPDIIYLDPMFPPRNKSAAVKKEMRLVKLLVGEDPDADNLLDIALEHARKRVVVKRPSYAPYLNTQKPSMCIESKGNRFDVYIK